MIKRLKQKWFWSKNSEQGPPDLEEMIKKFFGKKSKKTMMIMRVFIQKMLIKINQCLKNLL
ncbi:hypothetical protein BF30_1813 [Francisella philomiragia]|nr:hypothetical protein BF30_1813 [Francisella philomiragia]